MSLIDLDFLLLLLSPDCDLESALCTACLQPLAYQGLVSLGLDLGAATTGMLSNGSASSMFHASTDHAVKLPNKSLVSSFKLKMSQPSMIAAVADPKKCHQMIK